MVGLDPREPRDDAEQPAGAQVLLGGARVVARGQRDVPRLVEGVLAGLAGLPHDEVEDLGLPVEHQVVQAQQHGGPVGQRSACPRLLGASRTGVGLGHVGRRRLRHVRHRLAVDRREDLLGPSRRRDDPPRQGRDVVGLQGVRRAGIVLRVMGAVDQRAAGGALRGHVLESSHAWRTSLENEALDTSSVSVKAPIAGRAASEASPSGGRATTEADPSGGRATSEASDQSRPPAHSRWSSNERSES